MRDEIIAGLQNAIARGQTLEQAAQSFINAGYNPQEVKAAYQMLSSGATNVIANPNSPLGQNVKAQQNMFSANYGKPQQAFSNQVQNVNPQQVQQMRQAAAPVAPPNNLPEKKKGGSTAVLIIMIVLAALIFLGALGYLFYVLYMK